MKFLLVAVNAKYIHSNLGVYSLKAWADRRKAAGHIPGSFVEIGEYTINHQTDGILQDIYKKKPDFVGFSCYIWNIQYVRQLVRNLARVLPGTVIWLGGPEVSYDAQKVMEEEPAVTGVMVGEGEETFGELAEYYDALERMEQRNMEDIRGIVFRNPEGGVTVSRRRPLLSMDSIPFPYSRLEGLENRIIYYESSRGCPYFCTYCLSSLHAPEGERGEKAVRFRSLSLVKEELSFFLENKVPQVKFVDRTFNCNKKHCLEIWRYLQEHDNGVTNFHFEISADLLGEEQLDVLRQMRPGLVQLEIGVQTANPETIREIRRETDLERLERAVERIRSFGNIHQHLDLIAGLPCENFESFCCSFDRVYRMRPDQLQLGFLKVLKGSYMAGMGEEYGLVYHEEPPYEVLFTRWLDYGQVLRLKAVEEMVEVYYNSGQFQNTLREMDRYWKSPCAMFEAIGAYYESRGMNRINHSRLARYEILHDFLEEREPEHMGIYRDLLVFDLYLRENVKSRPKFAADQGVYKAVIRDFFIQEHENPRYLRGYEGYDSRQMAHMAHVEVMGDGRIVLFDYKNRNPLNYNARTAEIGRLEHG